MTRLCKDCVHYRPCQYGTMANRCGRPDAREVDIVTGETKDRYCFIERGFPVKHMPHLCGPEGRFFEGRENPRVKAETPLKSTVGDQGGMEDEGRAPE